MRRLEPLDPSSFLVDADQERTAGGGFQRSRKLRDLTRVDHVAGKEDDPPDAAADEVQFGRAGSVSLDPDEDAARCLAVELVHFPTSGRRAAANSRMAGCRGKVRLLCQRTCGRVSSVC